MSSSIKEVAQRAGVSVATVSHVINDTRFVSDTTRQKVLAAVEELQYSPNILARKFKTGSRDTVGFIVPDIANGYFATAIEEVEDVLQTRGFRLIVSNTRENPTRELDSLRMLSSGVVDGLVLVSTLNDYAEVETVLPPGFPVVLFDRSLAHASVDTITTDNTKAIREGIAALVGRGHRAIGFMASVRHLSTTADRVGAYRDALREHGLEPDERLIRYLESMSDPIRPSAEALLDQGCTAIVASNNVLTGKLLAALHAGSWAWRDLEILGYRDPTHIAYPPDDTQWLEEPIAEMGRLAGEAIVRRLVDQSSAPQAIVLNATFSSAGTDRGRAG
ncbi:LacI family DNA-binding transcriptional regulator [Cellulomonas sp. 73-92]|uniref:LacI family DNA-binding transcriptional regulator n=1 Tax=Cellulomonas sp. 73-92 TaxID=1895740 RepID=UPI000ABB5CDC|nr:LacI family DNA-binding transcriptional regulator [Cellulomonas sp. 73-92]